MNIIKLAINKPKSTCTLFLVIFVFGIISFTKLKTTLLPKIIYPKLTIFTLYKNVPPAEIEELITSPIEESIFSVNGVKRIESISRQGLSVVIPTFTWGTDIDIASVDVREKLDTISSLLPKEIIKPLVMRIDPSSTPIIGIGLFPKINDMGFIKRIVEKEIKPEFERQEGIAKVSIKGALTEEIQVEIDLDRMNAYQLSIPEIKTALKDSTYNFPAGNIVENKTEYLIRVDGEYKSLNDIESTVIGVTEEGNIIKTKDIAKVKKGFKDRTSYFLLNNTEGIGLEIIKESSANDILISENINKLIKKINKKFDSLLELKIIYDNSTFIEESINELLLTGILAIIITFFVIFSFFRNIKVSLIIAITIPISIFTCFIFMYLANMTLNIMSIGGLILGIGMLVDNSIIIINEIEGKSDPEFIFRDVSNVAFPIFSSTFTTLIVFIPLIFIKGIAGTIFGQLALTISFSLISSIVISLFLVPVLYLLFCNGFKSSDTSFFIKLKEKLVKLVHSGFKSIKRVFILLILFLLITILLFILLKKQFMPVVDRGKFTLNITFNPGIPIEDNRRYLSDIIEEIKKNKNVKNIYTNIGYEDDDPYVLLQEEVGVHVSKLIVLLNKKRKKNVFKIVNELTNKIKYRDDLKIVYEIPNNVITEILNVKKYDFSIDIGSDDRTIIDQSAFTLFNKLEQSKLFKEIDISKKKGNPQIRIYFDYDSLAGSGVNSKAIYELLNTAVKGSKVSDYKIDDDLIDITLRLQEEDRTDIKDLDRYKLLNKDMKIPINAFIKHEKQESPSKILRKNQNEIIKLYGNYLKNNKKSETETNNIINSFIKENKNVFVSQQDEVIEMNESFNNLLFAFLFSIFLVYALLASQFESFLKPIIIMTCVPFSFLGSLLFLFITGNSININSIMGIIMLSGIVVNNSIILFDKYSKNMNLKNMTLENSILTGTKDRIKPVLMTSFTTICGLIPMAIGIGRGGKLQSSLAISVLGGLLLSTFITFFILPNLYYISEKKKKK